MGKRERGLSYLLFGWMGRISQRAYVALCVAASLVCALAGGWFAVRAIQSENWALLIVTPLLMVALLALLLRNVAEGAGRR